jgi:hypothetical protein
MIKPIAIQLRERSAASRAGEPLRFGVPFARGELHDTQCLKLSVANGAVLPVQTRPLAYWPDNSIRWACVEAVLPATEQPLAGLTLAQGKPTTEKSASISRNGNQLQISYGAYHLTPKHDAPSWQWSGPDDQFSSRLMFEDQDNLPCSALMDAHWEIETTGPVVTVLSAAGWWVDSQGDKLARFRCELGFYANGLVTADTMIHNPHRAKHSGGLWDLGDPGSVRFGGMAVETHVAGITQYRLSLAPDQPPKTFTADQSVTLHQESSGGENWNSRNHINAKGQLLPRYRGYRLQHGQQEPEYGLRASPVLEATTADSLISISLPHFWQNFPSGLDAGDDTLRAWLFPADKPEPYELQGGERKTQQVILGYGFSLEQLGWSHSPLVPILPAEHDETTEAFPWFRANQPGTPLDHLIQDGLDGTSNFFAKREMIDEFGWRNFGDLFADHETLYQREDEAPHISHYNNQYDAIYGFARQFALTGDPRWFELMDDLARHVADIDIYHTDEDRSEYNHGLFWHTDHYLDAYTCTHRTFTRNSNSSSTPGQLGGGPAAEHCYTSGLLYHYWLTGNRGSKEAVLELAHWMKTLHQGEKGLLAEVLALKKQELPRLKALLRGDDVTTHRYPFTRGTGNYINTLLDAYLAQPDAGWLTQAEDVIRNTIHPADNIEQRRLRDTENSWSYLILLASLARYLSIKADADDRDDHWHYTRASFLHYTRWMLKNERPFLENPGDLEFANDTWTAQDIRKAMLMFQAAQEDPANAERYREKGQEWLNHVTSALRLSPERGFTRLQIILLQNYGPQHLTTTFKEECPGHLSSYTPPDKAPELSWTTLASQIVSRLTSGLLHFRPHREKAWLEARLDRQ